MTRRGKITNPKARQSQKLKNFLIFSRKMATAILEREAVAMPTKCLIESKVFDTTNEIAGLFFKNYGFLDLLEDEAKKYFDECDVDFDEDGNLNTGEFIENKSVEIAENIFSNYEKNEINKEIKRILTAKIETYLNDLILEIVHNNESPEMPYNF